MHSHFADMSRITTRTKEQIEWPTVFRIRTWQAA